MKDIYQSCLLWFILAYVVPHQYLAVGAFIIALWHVPAAIWLHVARNMAEDKEFDGLPRRTESGN